MTHDLSIRGKKIYLEQTFPEGIRRQSHVFCLWQFPRYDNKIGFNKSLVAGRVSHFTFFILLNR